MRDRLAILHIGVTKTGSSSIQSWLAANRTALGAAGLHVPEAFGHPNHQMLIRIADGTAPAGRMRRFTAEMAALPDAARSLVFTSEGFSVHLTTAEAIAQVKRLLDPHVDRYAIVAYLRRQDEHAVSSYSTAMRAGFLRRSDPLGARPRDYAAMLEAWAAVFGRDAIRPRIFAREDLAEGDVVVDFLAAIGVDLPPDAAPPAVARNASLRPEAQGFLAALAEHAARTGALPGGLRDMPNRRRLIDALDAQFAGPGLLPSRDAARAFYERCRDSNERVRATWFPERDTLFPGDFSRYPEAATPPPSQAAMFEVALATVLALMAEAPTPPAAAPPPPPPPGRRRHRE